MCVATRLLLHPTSNTWEWLEIANGGAGFTSALTWQWRRVEESQSIPAKASWKFHICYTKYMWRVKEHQSIRNGAYLLLPQSHKRSKPSAGKICHVIDIQLQRCLGPQRIKDSHFYMGRKNEFWTLMDSLQGRPNTLWTFSDVHLNDLNHEEDMRYVWKNSQTVIWGNERGEQVSAALKKVTSIIRVLIFMSESMCLESV